MKNTNLRNKLRMVWNFAKATIKYVSNGMKNVSHKEFIGRMVTCNKCPLLDITNGTCTVCGCEVSVKGSWATEKCPKGKWEKHRNK